jgi:hypothetical protein
MQDDEESTELTVLDPDALDVDLVNEFVNY